MTFYKIKFEEFYPAKIQVNSIVLPDGLRTLLTRFESDYLLCDPDVVAPAQIECLLMAHPLIVQRSRGSHVLLSGIRQWQLVSMLLPHAESVCALVTKRRIAPSEREQWWFNDLVVAPGLLSLGKRAAQQYGDRLSCYLHADSPERTQIVHEAFPRCRTHRSMARVMGISVNTLFPPNKVEHE